MSRSKEASVRCDQPARQVAVELMTPGGARNDRGPDPFGIRASFEPALASWEGVRLRASLARLHLVLIRCQLKTGGDDALMRVRAPIPCLGIDHRLRGRRQTGVHGRTATRCGSNAGRCKSAGFHGVSSMGPGGSVVSRLVGLGSVGQVFDLPSGTDD
jgi:hypothetical protein